MIQVKNLHFSYKKEQVFDGLDVNFEKGKIYGLLGKNGTGKSTLLHNIAGLLFPKEGEIRVDDFIPKKRTPEFLQEIALIPEEIYLPDISIKNLVKRQSVFYPRFSKEQFDTYLKEFQVSGDKNLRGMSYGQKKKVMISFYLACNTTWMLMDEPTNGLDIESKDQFKKMMARVMDDEKCVIISSHQVSDLETMIDQITIIDEGKLLFHQDLGIVADKLAFTFSNDKRDLARALYSEPALPGQAIVAPNTSGTSSKVDLALLYKTVLKNRGAVNELFND